MRHILAAFPAHGARSSLWHVLRCKWLCAGTGVQPDLQLLLQQRAARGPPLLPALLPLQLLVRPGLEHRDLPAGGVE
jgi:hypothetical protein